jgi:uncharacterized membrane protein YhdT
MIKKHRIFFPFLFLKTYNWYIIGRLINSYYQKNIDHVIGTQIFFDIDILINAQFFLKITYSMIMKKINNPPTLASTIHMYLPT